METWLLLIVMSLAVYRLTRLVVEDTFPPVLWLRDRLAGGWRPLTEKEQSMLTIESPNQWMSVVREPRVPNPAVADWHVQEIDGEQRRWVQRSKRSPFWLAELISCPWCASGWVALAVTSGTWAWVGLPVPVLVWFAVWAVGALIAGQEWA
jgi:hypothetical protein